VRAATPRFGDDKIDADVVGVIALLLASLLVVVAIVWLKRSKR
jgi:hypothetical protein